MEDELRDRLRTQFAWRGKSSGADVSGWWIDPEILRAIGPALATLHAKEEPTLVAGVEALGFLLGPLVALSLGVGFVEVRKDMSEPQIGERVAVRTTPPDYQDRGLSLGIRRRLLRPRERVLLVDEWIATGAQATAVKRIVEDLDCDFVGVAVIVDATDNRMRRELNVRSLLSSRGLSPG